MPLKVDPSELTPLKVDPGELVPLKVDPRELQPMGKRQEQPVEGLDPTGRIAAFGYGARRALAKALNFSFSTPTSGFTDPMLAEVEKEAAPSTAKHPWYAGAGEAMIDVPKTMLAAEAAPVAGAAFFPRATKLATTVLGKTLAPLTTYAERRGLGVLPRALLGGLEATGVSAGLGAAQGGLSTGSLAGALQGGVSGAASPANALGFTMPFATGLAKSAPGYERAASQAGSEILAPTMESAVALERRFGEGKIGHGIPNAGKRLLELKMPSGEPLVKPGMTQAEIADRANVLKEHTGAQKTDFTRRIDSMDNAPRVNSQGVVEDLQGIINDFRSRDPATVNPKSASVVNEMESWLANVKRDYGPKVEGISVPGESAMAPELQAGAPPTQKVYNHMGDLVEVPTTGKPPMVGSPGGVAGVEQTHFPMTMRPKPSGAAPVIRELPIEKTEQLKTYLDDYIAGESAKFPNPAKVAQTDPVLKALWRFRGTLKQRAEEAVQQAGEGALAEFKARKADYSEAKVIADSVSEGALRSSVAKASPSGDDLKRAVSQVIAGSAYHNPLHGVVIRGAHSAVSAIPSAETSTVGLKNLKKAGEALRKDRQFFGIPTGRIYGTPEATAAGIQLLRSREEK